MDASTIGKDIGGFLGGSINPLLGGTQDKTVTTSSTPAASSSTTTIVIVVVIVAVLALAAYFTFKK